MHIDPRIYNNQYKILHNTIISGEKLVKFKLSEDPHCSACPLQTDSITHMLEECPRTQECWEALEKWLKESEQIEYSLSQPERILGVVTDKDPWLEKIEILAAITRHYIVLNRQDRKVTTSPEGLKIYIKYKLNIMRLSRPTTQKREDFKSCFKYFL